MAAFQVKKIGPKDLTAMRELLAVYSEVFADPESYAAKPPSDAYLQRLLSREEFISLVAVSDEGIIGGLSGYVLEKFEQERSEVYIYDLAVKESSRRQGVATALIRDLQRRAGALNAWVIYVQADYGDDPAIKLYESLGVREDVLHFDIPVLKAPPAGTGKPYR